VLSAEELSGSERVLVEGICAGLDIDGNDFAMISRLHPSAHLSFVDLITAPGRLLGRVTRLLWVHTSSPVFAHC